MDDGKLSGAPAGLIISAVALQFAIVPALIQRIFEAAFALSWLINHISTLTVQSRRIDIRAT